MPSLRVFITSPGELAEERDAVSLIVVPELRRIFADDEIFGTDRRIDVEAVRWETHSWPDVGKDAQDVINRQIGDFDILVGMMWRRFGTPTGRTDSGTGEEFQRAFDYHRAYGRPKIMFYFRTAPFYTTNPVDWEQFNRVLSFRQKLESLGVRFTEYTSPIEFERYVREHLVRQIFRLYSPVPKSDTAGGLKTLALGLHPKSGRDSVKVFLSYSRDDKAQARSVHQRLRDAGFEVWLDEESLLPGQQWDAEIDRAIRSSDVVLILLSATSITTSGYIQREIRYALDAAAEAPEGDKLIVPVRLEPVQAPERLDAYQWIDLFVEGGFDRLVRALDRVAGRKSMMGLG